MTEREGEEDRVERGRERDAERGVEGLGEKS